jgi:hypothetical protein
LGFHTDAGGALFPESTAHANQELGQFTGSHKLTGIGLHILDRPANRIRLNRPIRDIPKIPLPSLLASLWQSVA